MSENKILDALERKTNIQMSMVVLVIVVLAMAVILLLYINSPGKREDINVELIKLVGQGAVVGILGLWIKHLFDETYKNRERARIELERQSELNQGKIKAFTSIFETLMKTSRSAVDIAGMENWSTATDAFGAVDGHTYEDELLNWCILEPDGPAREARKAYDNLIIELKKNGDVFTPEKRELIKDRCLSWAKYCETIFYCATLGQDWSKVERPADWKQTI